MQLYCEHYCFSQLLMTFQVWLAFMLACWLISVSPGAGAIASMSSGLNDGMPRAYWNILGLQLALVLQVIIVAAGVGVLFATTPWAFELIKWFGVTYLLYLAYQQWLAPVQNIQIQQSQQSSAFKMVLRGFIVNMSNPKAIIFLLAVLPQFLDWSKPRWIQYGQMTVTMVVVDILVMSVYSGLAAKVLSLLKTPKQQRYLNRSFAVLFSCAALVLSMVHQAT